MSLKSSLFDNKYSEAPVVKKPLSESPKEEPFIPKEVIINRPMHLCPVDTSCGMGTTVSSTTYCSNRSIVHRPNHKFGGEKANEPRHYKTPSHH